MTDPMMHPSTAALIEAFRVPVFSDIERRQSMLEAGLQQLVSSQIAIVEQMQISFDAALVAIKANGELAHKAGDLGRTLAVVVQDMCEVQDAAHG